MLCKKLIKQERNHSLRDVTIFQNYQRLGFFYFLFFGGGGFRVCPNIQTHPEGTFYKTLVHFLAQVSLNKDRCNSCMLSKTHLQYTCLLNSSGY
ncbi:hypothetical protein C0J52_09972 [Blattella germanica]|nr:hypothetical protein C0J52_09972 [Blattella germanica]